MDKIVSSRVATSCQTVEAYCAKHGLSPHTRRLRPSGRSWRDFCNQCGSDRVSKRRRQRKDMAAASFGYRCYDCGLVTGLRALHFDHLEEKEFVVSVKAAVVPLDVFWAEVKKCVLRCAVCHRLRHASLPPKDCSLHPKRKPACRSCSRMYLFARRQAAWDAAIEAFGGQCELCGRQGPSRIFDFHHLQPTLKTTSPATLFAGLQYKRLVQELETCALLCANCHAEVEALDYDGVLRLRDEVKRSTHPLLSG